MTTTQQTSATIKSINVTKARLNTLMIRAMKANKTELADKFDAMYTAAHNAQHLIFACAWDLEPSFFSSKGE